MDVLIPALVTFLIGAFILRLCGVEPFKSFPRSLHPRSNVYQRERERILREHTEGTDERRSKALDDAWAAQHRDTNEFIREMDRKLGVEPEQAKNVRDAWREQYPGLLETYPSLRKGVYYDIQGDDGVLRTFLATDKCLVLVNTGTTGFHGAIEGLGIYNDDDDEE